MAQQNIKSQDQIVAEIITEIRNNSDVTDFNPGGALVSLIEAIAAKIYRNQLNVLKIVEANNLDSQTGSLLDQAASSVGLPNLAGGIGRRPATRASGDVVISDDFIKVSTVPYQGKPAPYKGSREIYANYPSEGEFPTGTFNIYIGRNSVSNFEGPIQVNSMTDNGTYLTLNLDIPLSKDHRYTDEVVLAQGGDRVIPAGTQVFIPPTSGLPQVNYFTNLTITIPDGEPSLPVGVTAELFGSSGNADAFTVRQFAAIPFNGAFVGNPATFVNGQDVESDASLRQRIRDFGDTLSRGTRVALANALAQVVDPETGDTITSSSFASFSDTSLPQRVYVDDGAGLEPTFGQSEYELLLAVSSGLEQHFRTAKAPITMPLLKGTTTGPFILATGDSLTFVLDGTQQTYTVDLASYPDPASANALQVCQDLNTQSAGSFDLVEFRAYDGGTKIAVTDKRGTGEILEVLPSSLQEKIGLPLGPRQALYLYKNSELLRFKGQAPRLESSPYDQWALGLFTTLNSNVVSVDGVSVTFSVSVSDFASAPSFLNQPSLSEWVTVLQGKIPGVTVSFIGQSLLIASNKGASDQASIAAVSGPWIGIGRIFAAAQTEQGAAPDYALNRFTGEISLSDSLEDGDRLEVSSRSTRGFIASVEPLAGQWNLTAATPNDPSQLVVAFDGVYAQKVVPEPGQATLTLEAANLRMRLVRVGATQMFQNVSVGDWIFLARDTELNPGASFAGIDVGRLFPVTQIVKSGSDTTEIFVEISQFELTGPLAPMGGLPISLSSSNFGVFSSTTQPAVVSFGSNTLMSADDLLAYMNTPLRVTGGTLQKVSPSVVQLRSNRIEGGTAAVLYSYKNAARLFEPAVGLPLTPHLSESLSEDAFGTTPVVDSVTNSNGAFNSLSFPYSFISTRPRSIVMTNEADPRATRYETAVAYQEGFQVEWMTGKFFQSSARVYNQTGTATFNGVTETLDNPLLPGSVWGTGVLTERNANLSQRMTDLSVTDQDVLVTQLDGDPESKTLSTPMGKRAKILTYTYTGTAPAQGTQATMTLADPEDGDLPFANASSPFRAFPFNDFGLSSKATMLARLVAGADPVPSVIVRSTRFQSPSRPLLSVDLAAGPNQPNVLVSHQNIPTNLTEDSLVTATLVSGLFTVGSTIDTGTYSISSSPLANNLRRWTIAGLSATTGYVAGNVLVVGGSPTGAFNLPTGGFIIDSTTATTITFTTPDYNRRPGQAAALRSAVKGEANVVRVQDSTFRLLDGDSVTLTANTLGIVNATYSVYDCTENGGFKFVAPSGSGSGTVSYEVSGTTAISAAQFPLNTYVLTIVTRDQIATALQDYGVLTGLYTVQSVNADGIVSRPTYIVSPRSGTLPPSVLSCAQGKTFHATRATRALSASVLSNPANTGSFTVVLKSEDPLFPVDAAFNPVGEEVYLSVSNSTTMTRWLDLSAVSSLKSYASIERTDRGSRVQISSDTIGSSGQVFVRSTFGNSTEASPLLPASAQELSTVVRLDRGVADGFAPASMVKIENLTLSPTSRPYAESALATSPSVTIYNPSDVSSWFVPNSGFIDAVQSGSSVRVSLQNFFELNVAPYTNHAITCAATSTPGVTRVSIASPGVLPARVGQMFYVNHSFVAGGVMRGLNVGGTRANPVTTTALNANYGTGDAIYPGFPILHVESAQTIYVQTGAVSGLPITFTATAPNEVQFVQPFWAEKNVRTTTSEGLAGTKAVGNTPTLITGTTTYVLKPLGRNVSVLRVLNGTVPSVELAKSLVATDDWLILGPKFAPANQGRHRILAIADNTNIYFYSETGQDEILNETVSSGFVVGGLSWGVAPFDGATSLQTTQKFLRVLDANSVVVGSRFVVQPPPVSVSSWFPPEMQTENLVQNTGLYADSGWVRPYIDVPLSGDFQTLTAVPLDATRAPLLSFKEETPYKSMRYVSGYATSQDDPQVSEIALVPARLGGRIDPALFTTLEAVGKPSFPEINKVGLSGYEVFSGLIGEAHRVIDGVPANPIEYEGVKAEGTYIEILPPLISPLTISLRVRPRDGVSLVALSAYVRSTVSSYVQRVPVGTPLVLSELLSEIQQLPGVASVQTEATDPPTVDDRVPVAANEKLLIQDVNRDVLVGGFEQ